jgi:hypothetical protein
MDLEFDWDRPPRAPRGSFLGRPYGHLPAYLDASLASYLTPPSCPQRGGCWGPWVLNSNASEPILYDTGPAHHARFGLYQPNAGEKTMDVAAEVLAFLVHLRWAGPQVTGGLLNAYASIFGLTGYGPDLAAMHFTEAQVRKLARAAIDDPANVLHVHSFDDIDRTDHHLAELARREEAPAPAPKPGPGAPTLVDVDGGPVET